jgi:hypothetical protein
MRSDERHPKQANPETLATPKKSTNLTLNLYKLVHRLQKENFHG